MERKILIEAEFSGNEQIVNTDSMWRYDKGQTLTISGIDGLNADSEVHFERKYHTNAIVKKGVYNSGDNSLTVDIPDVFFENINGEYSRVWVYLTGGNSGKTVREVRIPILDRVMPDNYVSQEDLHRDDVIQNAINDYMNNHPELDVELSRRKVSSFDSHSQTADSDNYPNVNAARNYTDFMVGELEDYVDDELDALDSAKENASNKVTSISGNSTNAQYPSALAVKNYVDAALGVIENGSY